jgi:hypothetical protein
VARLWQIEIDLAMLTAIRHALFLVNRFIVIRRHRSGDRLDTDCVARVAASSVTAVAGEVAYARTIPDPTECAGRRESSSVGRSPVSSSCSLIRH